MNLVFVYIQPINPINGGTERVSYAVANTLKSLGHKVYFLATHASSHDRQSYNTEEYILLSKELTYEDRKKKVIEVCKSYHIDIVINECAEVGLSSIFSNKLLSPAKVITCTHLDIYGLVKYFHRATSNSKFKRFLLSCLSFFGINPYYFKYYSYYKKIFREAVEVSDAFVVVTPVICQELQDFIGYKTDKIVSILNPLTSECTQPSYEAAKKEKMLLYVGRLSTSKNVDHLLKAWQRIAMQHKDWKLEIAGDGVEKERLLAMVHARNIPRVHFHGQVSNVELLYQRAEYLLLASDCESFSCVVLESMAHGCHPIVYDYPSAPVVIPSPLLGTRVHKHSPSVLAKVISRAISSGVSNKNELPRVAEHLSKFDKEKLGEQWQKLLNQLHSS